MERYVHLVHNLIEKPRNELRIKVGQSNDKKLREVLEKYETAYHRSCLKIEEYLEYELEKLDLNHKD